MQVINLHLEVWTCTTVITGSVEGVEHSAKLVIKLVLVGKTVRKKSTNTSKIASLMTSMIAVKDHNCSLTLTRSSFYP